MTLPEKIAGEIGKLALAISLVVLVWVGGTLEPASWPDAESATSVARSSIPIEPGQSMTFPIEAISGHLDGIEIRTEGETSGALDMSILDRADSSVLAAGSANFNGDVTAYLATKDILPGAALNLRLDRPLDSRTGISISVRSAEQPDQISYLWYSHRSYLEVAALLLRGLPGAVPLLAATMLWLSLPGALIWRMLRLPRPGSAFESIALLPVIVAVSMGAVLLAAAVMSYVPVRLNFLAQYGRASLIAAGVALLVWLGTAFFRARSAGEEVLDPVDGSGRLSNWIATGVFALGAVIALLVFARSGATIDLPGPAGVDGTAVVDFSRRIEERGALLDLSPEAISNREDLYHLGLSGLTALVSWSSGAPLDSTLVFVGQALQCVAILGLVTLAGLVGGGPWGATAAVLVAAFVLPLPGFTLAWSRFTEIAGLAVIPGLLFVLQRTFASPRDRAIRYGVCLGLATCGLMLTHYRVLAFAIVFAPAAIALSGRPLKELRSGLAVSAAAAAVVTFLLLPWLIPVASQFWIPTVAATVEASEFPAWTLTSFGAGWVLAAMALVTGPSASFSERRQLTGLLCAGWFALGLATLTLPAMLGWRMSVAINPLSAAIAIYLPCGIWAAWLFESLRRRIPRFAALAPAITVLLLTASISRLPGPGSFGARLADQLILTTADRAAIDWIREYMPTGAAFVINTAPWAYDLYIGADGGYWIESLTGRKALVPPLSYAYRPADARNAIGSQISSLGELPVEERIQRWKEAGFRYVYLGRHGGALDPSKLIGDNAGIAVYDRDGVVILDLEVRVSGS